MRHELETIDRIAYLIEIVNNDVADLIKARTARPLYYCIDRFNENGAGVPRARWTSNPYDALAFSRARDADAFMQLLEHQDDRETGGHVIGNLRLRQYAEVREHAFEEPVRARV